MLSSMEERFKQEEAELLKRKREAKSEAGVKSEDDGQIKDEDLDSQLADEDDIMSDEEANVARDVNLPSSLDSKLWRLKVKNGLERQLVMKLTNKLFACLNNGNPLMVLQVFECENIQGAVFVEAYKLSHVE
jgi:hypothetical protein